MAMKSAHAAAALAAKQRRPTAEALPAASVPSKYLDLLLSLQLRPTVYMHASRLSDRYLPGAAFLLQRLDNVYRRDQLPSSGKQVIDAVFFNLNNF